MAEEIQAAGTTAKTLYAVVRNSVGQVLTISGLTFGSYVTANLANYVIALTEQGTASGFYSGDMPAIPAGIYSVAVYQQGGGSPAEGDTLVASGNIDWTGTVVESIGSGVNVVQFNGQPTVGGKDWYHTFWYMASVCAGQLPSGAGSGTEAWKDFGGTLAVTFTVDANGNRTGAYA